MSVKAFLQKSKKLSGSKSRDSSMGEPNTDFKLNASQHEVHSEKEKIDQTNSKRKLTLDSLKVTAKADDNEAMRLMGDVQLDGE